MYPISCEDENSCEEFAGSDQENLLSDTNITGVKNLEDKKVGSSCSKYEQLAIKIVEEESMFSFFFALSFLLNYN